MSNEIKLIDRIRAEAVVYSGYSLSRNPFPETGKAPPHPSFCAGRDAVLNKLYDFIADVYNHESLSGLVMLGTIGGGKTHILRYVRDKITNELRDVPSGDAMAIYVENPQTGVLHIYSEFMSGMGSNVYIDVLWKALKKQLSKEISENKVTLEHLRPEPKYMERWVPPKGYSITNILDLAKNIESFRENIANGNLAKDKVENLFNRYLSPYISDKDFLTCSVKLLLEDDLSLLNESWNFICGLRVNKETQRTLRLLKSALTTKDLIKSVLKTVIDILKAAGYKVMFLLLDEVETLASLGPQTRFFVLDEFRSFFDAIPSNFGIILACTPRDWQQIVSTYPALRDRIKHVVELGYMGPEEAAELIKAYITSVRTSEIADPLYPFSQDAIIEICRLKNGIVRYIVESCYNLLKEGAKQNFPLITRGFVSKHIKPIEAQSLE